MIQQVSTGDVGLHPLLKDIPLMTAVAARLSESPKSEVRDEARSLTAEWDAFVESVRENGVLEPLKVTPAVCGGFLCCDGRHRLKSAEICGLPTVPVEIVSDDQARKIIEATVIARRSWSQGMKAYFAVTMHPEIARLPEGRRGDSTPHSVRSLTAEGLATQYGISPRTLEQAMQLFRTFHAAPDADDAAKIEAEALREQYESSIWAGHGLGAVIAGIGGGQVTTGQSKPSSGFHGLAAPFGTLARFSRRWTKWDDAERAKARALTERWLEKDVHPEFRLMLAEALASLSNDE